MILSIYLSLSLLFLAIPLSYADDGVLESSSAHLSLLDQGSSPQDDSTSDNKPASNSSSSSAKENGNSANAPSSDDVIVKRTNAVVFEMQANLKLTPDQVNAITPIISDTIVKVTDLEQKLKDGTIDSKGMYSDRLSLITDANQQLSAILSSDQMKTWENMQDTGSYF